MKLVVRSLCVSAVFVLGYVGVLLILFQLGAFEVLGPGALNAMTAPMDLPEMIRRLVWGVRLSWVGPFIWSLCGNILIYFLPIYIFLRLRGGDKLR